MYEQNPGGVTVPLSMWLTINPVLQISKLLQKAKLTF